VHFSSSSIVMTDFYQNQKLDSHIREVIGFFTTKKVTQKSSSTKQLDAASPFGERRKGVLGFIHKFRNVLQLFS